MTRSAQRVDSVLRTLNRTTLPKLHPQSSMQWVYGLTGQAGSCMYMSPECFAHLPYNEKADVFSFGELNHCNSAAASPTQWQVVML